MRKNIKDIYKTDPEAPERSTHILCDACGKPGLKPRTVLYGKPHCHLSNVPGSNLPAEFFEKCNEDFPDNVDLLIVAGTSLTVGPANSLVCYVDHLFSLLT